MKKDSKINIDRCELYKKINNVPYFAIGILMLFLTPIGVWFFVVRIIKSKRKMYGWGSVLRGIGLFILFIVGVAIYSKIKEIIVLCDSGMSLDMINLIPDKIYLYIIGIIMCSSFIIGGKKLIDKAKIEQIYTRSINIEHETSIKKISAKLEESIEEVKNNIIVLSEKGYLVPLEIVNNKINYVSSEEGSTNTKVLSRKNKENKIVQCNVCGTLVSLKSYEYVECDFCGNGLIEENNK